MGIFANGSHEEGGEFVGMWIGPRPEKQNGLEGYEAMGQKVPFDRRQEGYKHLKDMGFTDKEQMFHMVQMLADRIERDEVHGGMEELYKRGLDVTGIYRLLAVMLHDPPQEQKPPEFYSREATYLDLVGES